jgi:hypothetical protein
MSTITETLKAKLDELDLDRRVDELTTATEHAVKRALTEIGDLAHDNRDRVSTLLDKAGTALDQRTDGRYAAQFAKVREQVETGVDKLAGKRGEHTSKQAGSTTAAEPTSHEAASTEAAVTPQEAEAGSASTGETDEQPSSWSAHTDQV